MALLFHACTVEQIPSFHTILFFNGLFYTVLYNFHFCCEWNILKHLWQCETLSNDSRMLVFCEFNTWILPVWQPFVCGSVKCWLLPSWRAGFNASGSRILKFGAFLFPLHRKKQAPLRCGGRWPCFCGCYYRMGAERRLTHNPPPDSWHLHTAHQPAAAHLHDIHHNQRLVSNVETSLLLIKCFCEWGKLF